MTVTDRLVTLTKVDGIGRIRLQRPENRNALSARMIDELASVIGDVENDADLRVVIIEGEGRSFCAGMDLKGVRDDPTAMGGMLEGLARISVRIRDLSIPTIARAQGAAIGGGCGLLAICDFALTHPEAKIGYPEVDLGICPAVVAPWLIQRIGAGKARSLLLAGGTMTGEAALAYGLVDECVPLERLDEAVERRARRILAGGPNAIRVTKEWLNELEGDKIRQDVLKGGQLSASVIRGEEAQSRIRALWKD
ncbi:MAG: enoyl-CoA hydratase [Phycisphaerae bacterium]|nr:enoyl-CoA hydratase [Phycisphaerae bacterium]HAW95556.1 enoyl-CoA hydratase [Phycisphaerales bacterium]